MSKRISTSLSCSICYNAYDRDTYRPCTLVCGHSLCSMCVRALERCPICSAVNTNRYDLKPSYEMMYLIDENQKFKLERIEEKVKRLAPEYYASVKTEQARLSQVSQEVKERFRAKQAEMILQKEMVEKSFQYYLNDWEKKYALLLELIDFENVRIEELGREMKEFSSFNSILKMMNNDQSPKELQRNLDKCIRDFKSFKYSTFVKKCNYEYVQLKPPVFHSPIYEIKIPIPIQYLMSATATTLDWKTAFEEDITFTILRRRPTNPFDDSFDDSYNILDEEV